jgi:hypothetical protein
MSRNNAVRIITRLWAVKLRIRGRFLEVTIEFSLSKMRRLALRTTQASILWVLGALSSWVKRTGSEEEKGGS